MTWLVNFFDCSDASLSDTETGQTIVGAVSSGVVVPDSVRFYALSAAASLSGSGWTDIPPGADMCMMVCGTALDSSGEGDGREAIGNICLYMGDAGDANKAYRVQPYLVGAGGGTDRTSDYADLVRRRTGINYIFAFVLRGNYIEHYAYDDLSDSYIYGGSHELSFQAERSFANSIQLGHSSSGYPTGGLNTTSDREQDFYGFAVFHFPSGAPWPGDIVKAMQYHREQWAAGNKQIYQPWIDEEYANMTTINEATPASVPLADDVAMAGVQGNSDVSVSVSQLQTSTSSFWQGAVVTNKNGAVACCTGNIVTDAATEVAILGAVNAVHLLPFVITRERAAIGFSSIFLRKQNNPGATANRFQFGVYDAFSGLLLGTNEPVINDPTVDGFLGLAPPTVTWPTQFYFAISCGVAGGSGASYNLSRCIMTSHPGFPGWVDATVGQVGLSAAPPFLIASSWDSFPANLSAIDSDLVNINEFPFILLG